MPSGPLLPVPCSRTGEWRLCLAIGKSAGIVAVWSSPSFSSMTSLQGMPDGGDLCSASMGSSTVVGLAWTVPPVQGQAPAMVLTAAGQDGSLSSWKVAGQEVCRLHTLHFTRI